jgi:PII-like signaling protein
MELKGKSKLLKIYLGSEDMVNDTPLHQVIIYAARKYGIAGATVSEGILSYGANSLTNELYPMKLSEAKPVTIELIDNEEKIDGFIHIIQNYFKNAKYGGIITISDVNVLVYKKHRKTPGQ